MIITLNQKSHPVRKHVFAWPHLICKTSWAQSSFSLCYPLTSSLIILRASVIGFLLTAIALAMTFAIAFVWNRQATATTSILWWPSWEGWIMNKWSSKSLLFWTMAPYHTSNHPARRFFSCEREIQAWGPSGVYVSDFREVFVGFLMVGSLWSLCKMDDFVCLCAL